MVLWWTTANPTCRLRSEPLPCTGSDRRLHLAFLATRRPTLHPAGHRVSSQAYLSLHSSEAPQGIDLSRPLFTCTNTNQAATCTCNTWPRVSPHHVVNHSSQPGATIHWSLDAPVLSSSCNVRISNRQNSSLSSSRRRSAGNLPLSSWCNKYSSLYNRRSPSNIHCRRGTKPGNLCLNMRFLTVLLGQNRNDQNTSLVHLCCQKQM
jgi:hypothetical protein